MEFIIILAIAIASFYFLTKSFRQNPAQSRINIHVKQSLNVNLQDHEAGLLIALMAKVAKADGRISELEAEVIKNTLTQISQVFEEQSRAREMLKQIYIKEKEDFSNTIVICEKYLRLTKNEYDKRLNLMQYLLNIAFIDGDFSEHEKMITEDIANALKIKSADFAKMISQFISFYESKKAQKSMDIKQAYEILEANENESFEQIKKKYRNLVRKNHPDILMGQGKSEDIIKQATQKLQTINEAYELIKTQKA